MSSVDAGLHDENAQDQSMLDVLDAGDGSPVRLIEGFFAKAKGVLDRIAGLYRVSVLLQPLGREVRVFVPVVHGGAV